MTNQSKKKKNGKRPSHLYVKIPLKILKWTFLSLIVVCLLGGAAALGLFFASVNTVPAVDFSSGTHLLDKHSEIVDQNGNLIEKIQTEQFRTIVTLENISQPAQDAFVAIEDKRFEEHNGIDLKRIVGALVADIKAGKVVQGASTITQQTVKNLYLQEYVVKDYGTLKNLFKDVDRKIKEAYLAIELEKYYSKDQILEAYMNTIYLGQGAYGIEEAAQTYFSKSASDLTVAESAFIAGITKGTVKYSGYKTVAPKNYDPSTMTAVGEIEILGTSYVAILNQNALDRQKIILNEMKNQELIDASQYQLALEEDIGQAMQPGNRKTNEVNTSYFNDYLIDEVIDDLIEEYGYSRQYAQNLINTGGLRIYSTMDVELQRKVEDIYSNFDKVLYDYRENTDRNDIPYIANRVTDQGDLLNTQFESSSERAARQAAGRPAKKSSILYYFVESEYVYNEEIRQIEQRYSNENFISADRELIIPEDEYRFDESGNLIITSNRINYRNLDITNYYTFTYPMLDEINHQLLTGILSYADLDLERINESYQDYRKDSESEVIAYPQFTTHSRGYIRKLEDDNYSSNSDDQSVTIFKTFLTDNSDFYTLRESGELLISPGYLYINTTGAVQPQASSVVMDYRTGYVTALMGGRDLEGAKIYNRAIDASRQPGSSIKPLSVYTPALDSGFTASSMVEDIPHYINDLSSGPLPGTSDQYSKVMWPSNWYGNSNTNKTDDFNGYVTLREAVKWSMNVPAVTFLERIGIDTSMEYLKKFHVIETRSPSEDTFIQKFENPSQNDEGLAPLALGGLTDGITNLCLTAAYGAIANEGTYTEPIVYTKVLDANGEVILTKQPEKNTVVTPQVSYIMTDILNDVVNTGTGTRARLTDDNKGMPVAGKTGTTQNNADTWFVGYSAYYVSASWIGNDDLGLKLGYSSSLAKYLWKPIMTAAHENLEPKDFPIPEGIKEVYVDGVSGKLPTSLSARDPRGSQVYLEKFISGTEPTTFDDIHVEVVIDPYAYSDVLVEAALDAAGNPIPGALQYRTPYEEATPLCPAGITESRVFLNRDYDPGDHLGFIPKDFIYQKPSEKCHLHNPLTMTGYSYDLFGNVIYDTTPPDGTETPDESESTEGIDDENN
jgi:penicillin-binding protein 1A